MQSTSTMMSTWLALYNSQSPTKFRSPCMSAVLCTQRSEYQAILHYTTQYLVHGALNVFIKVEMSDAIPDGVVSVCKSVHAVV